MTVRRYFGGGAFSTDIPNGGRSAATPSLRAAVFVTVSQRSTLHRTTKKQHYGYFSLLVIALLLCFAALPAASWAENRCAGGGKPRPDEGGIGGTGAVPSAPEEDDSGIGGTGISASGETGIIGTITGFASICVGAVEVHYDGGSSVDIDGEPATPAALTVGQVVEVVADGSGDEITAKQITVRHVVAGPVTSFDAGQRTLAVMGQPVALPAESNETYEVGAPVKVSGLRRSDGVIAASLITSGAGDTVYLNGPVARAESGVLGVGETRIAVGGDTTVTTGEHVRVVGRWDGSQIVATSVQAQPRIPFDGRVQRVEIEGFATAIEAGRVRVGMFELERAASAGPLPTDVPVRVHALIRDRRAFIERVGPAGERPPRPNPPDGARPNSGTNPNGIPQLGVDPTGRDFKGAPHERPESARPQAMEGRPNVEAPTGEQPPRPQRPERPEHPERPEGAPERPPRVERPEPPQRPEMPDRPQRPERPDPPPRPPK